MKALVGAFNQEKALVGAFSVIVKTDCETDGSFAALGLGLAQLGAEPPRPPAEARVPGDPGAVAAGPVHGAVLAAAVTVTINTLAEKSVRYFVLPNFNPPGRRSMRIGQIISINQSSGLVALHGAVVQFFNSPGAEESKSVLTFILHLLWTELHTAQKLIFNWL